MRFRIIVAIAFLAIATLPTAHAQQYSFQYYGVDQGLADLAVRALYQDTRGFLWLATENGVFRYDGERFQAIGLAEGLPASNAAMFGEAPDGSLLVGGKFGLYRKNNRGHFERLTMPGATRVMWGAGIQSRGHGETYIATDAGLVLMTRGSDSRPLRMRLIDSPPHTGPPAANSVLVEDGAVWWGCGDEICLAQGAQTTVFGTEAGIRPGQWHGFKRAGNGDLWAQSAAGTVSVLRQGRKRFEASGLPLLSGFGPRGLIDVDAEGSVIIPVDDGLAVEEAGYWHIVGRAAGLRGPVYAVLKDREGTLWLGLAGHGLARWLGYGQWEYFNSDNGMGSDLAYEVAAAGKDAFWAGTDGGLFLGRHTKGVWNWERQSKVGDVPIHTVRPDGNGRLWLGTEGRGAARLDPKTGRVEWFRAEQGLTAESPYTMMLDRENRIWAASTTGLFVADLRTLRFHPVEGIPASAFCLAVVEAANGDVWAGTNHGLFRISHGQVSRFTTAQGLSNNEVLSLAVDRNDDIWVGYQFGSQIDRIRVSPSGVAVHPERIDSVDSRGTTYFLGFDVQGGLWAGTNRGVNVRNGAAWEHYDHHDGLVWDDCDLNGFHANPDGTVWIGTSAGLALFTPRSAALMNDPPAAILTKLTLGKRTVDAGQPVSVDHTVNSLTARFSALTFAREDAVLFRYRLTPLSTEWRETHERELQFPGLPANSYRFEVQARDGWGRWSGESARFDFEVRPPFWRAWWFITLCSLILLAMAAAALRLRDNALRRRERDLVRVVDARTAQLKEANQSLEDATSQLREANRHLVELSTLDGLTGLVNRRAFDLALEREWERHRRFGTPLSMILADIDCFKKLNDANGHQAGDECLRLVAGALGANGRSGVDCVARYGGEEFVLLLPGVDAAQAARLAEVARARVEQLQLPHPDSVAGRYVTISLGVATATGQYGNAQALIGAADTALYAAKSRGRNIVVSANDAPGEGSLGQDLRRLGEELQTKALLVGESG